MQRFKKKWLKTIPVERIKEIVDGEVEDTRKELYKAFGLEGS